MVELTERVASVGAEQGLPGLRAALLMAESYPRAGGVCGDCMPSQGQSLRFFLVTALAYIRVGVCCNSSPQLSPWWWCPSVWWCPVQLVGTCGWARELEPPLSAGRWAKIGVETFSASGKKNKLPGKRQLQQPFWQSTVVQGGGGNSLMVNGNIHKWKQPQPRLSALAPPRSLPSSVQAHAFTSPSRKQTWAARSEAGRRHPAHGTRAGTSPPPCDISLPPSEYTCTHIPQL